MSPVGVNRDNASAWDVYSLGYLSLNYVRTAYLIRTVLNLKPDVSVTGSGTSADPWVVV